MGRKRKYKKRGRSYNYKPVSFDISKEAKNAILGVILTGVGVLIILSIFNLMGQLGVILNEAMASMFGYLRLVFGIILTGLGITIFIKKPVRFLNYIGLIFFILSLSGLVHVIGFRNNDLYEIAKLGEGGGYAGFLLSYPLMQFVDYFGTILISIVLFLISIILTFNTSFATLSNIVKYIGIGIYKFFVGIFLLIRGATTKEFSPFEKREYDDGEDKEDEEDTDEEEEEYEEEENDIIAEKYKTPKTSLPIAIKKRRPMISIPLALLSKKDTKASGGDIKNNMIVIEKTLQNFNINVEMGPYKVGPTITQYTLKPSEGVRLSKITGLSNDLALALAAHPIRIEAPIPGKSLVGIEVPNENKAIVNLKDLLASTEYKKSTDPLTITIGKDVAGNICLANLAKMPHMLVAGSTGSGKSVSLHTIILSLLYKNSPDDLKLILVDAKRVEFPVYDGIPHLITPVIKDPKKTVNALKWAIGEMERRLDLFEKAKSRDIISYNSKSKSYMPYIVIIIDELADLIAASGAEIEACIVRLAQKSRAAGIHLILATQRPSVDIITGTIKANINARIAFSVNSAIDSRTILDESGAEKLLGKGDMLFTTAEISKPKRLQGAFVSENDPPKIVRFLKDNYSNPEYDESVVEKQKTQVGNSGLTMESDDDDPLIEEALEIIFDADKAAASLLQRKLSIGYARAARILDILEQNNIIGPSNGAKPREILMKRSEINQVAETPLHNEEYEEEEEMEDNNEEDIDNDDEENESNDDFEEEEGEYNNEDEEEEEYV